MNVTSHSNQGTGALYAPGRSLGCREMVFIAFDRSCVLPSRSRSGSRFSWRIRRLSRPCERTEPSHSPCALRQVGTHIQTPKARALPAHSACPKNISAFAHLSAKSIPAPINRVQSLHHIGAIGGQSRDLPATPNSQAVLQIPALSDWAGQQGRAKKLPTKPKRHFLHQGGVFETHRRHPPTICDSFLQIEEIS